MVNYVMYLSCLMGIKYDIKNCRSYPTDLSFLKSQLVKLCRDYIVQIALMSLLQSRGYELFELNVKIDSFDHGFFDLIAWRHLLNNYFVARKLNPLDYYIKT